MEEFMGFEDEATAASVEALFRKLFEDDAKPAAVVVPRLKQMEFAYAVMKYLTKDIPGCKLSYKLYEPFKNVGSISVEAEELYFIQREWFARAAEFANNMEIYPLTNGRVRLSLGFIGISKPIE